MAARIFSSSLVVLLLHVCAVAWSQSEPDTVISFIGASVQLQCPLANQRTDPLVKWVDYVYNQQIEPQVIFSSVRNPERLIDANHPQQSNYEVDSKFTLTIRSSSPTDAGKYECIVQNDQQDIGVRNKFQVMVIGKPKCTGKTEYETGDTVELSCEAAFSGSVVPKLQWTRDNVILEDHDRYGIDVARKLLQAKARPRDDRKLYACTLTAGDMTETCEVVLTVRYKVQSLSVQPQRESYELGEEVTCTARGSPAPLVEWISPPASGVTSGEGWSKMRVPDSLRPGSRTFFQCSASNTVAGVTEIVTKNVSVTIDGILLTTISVVNAPRQVERPSDPAETRTGSGGGGSHLLIIAVVGAIAVLVVAVAALVICKRRNKKPDGAKPLPTKDQDDFKLHVEPNGKGSSPASANSPSPQDWYSMQQMSDFKQKRGQDLNRNSEESPLPWRKKEGNYQDTLSRKT